MEYRPNPDRDSREALAAPFYHFGLCIANQLRTEMMTQAPGA